MSSSSRERNSSEFVGGLSKPPTSPVLSSTVVCLQVHIIYVHMYMMCICLCSDSMNLRTSTFVVHVLSVVSIQAVLTIYWECLSSVDGYVCMCIHQSVMVAATRVQQAELFNETDSSCEIMVATDAIGMGLNL